MKTHQDDIKEALASSYGRGTEEEINMASKVVGKDKSVGKGGGKGSGKHSTLSALVSALRVANGTNWYTNQAGPLGVPRASLV